MHSFKHLRPNANKQVISLLTNFPLRKQRKKKLYKSETTIIHHLNYNLKSIPLQENNNNRNHNKEIEMTRYGVQCYVKCVANVMAA